MEPQWKKRRGPPKDTVEDCKALFLRSGYCTHPTKFFTCVNIPRTNVIQTLCGVCNHIMEEHYR